MNKETLPQQDDIAYRDYLLNIALGTVHINGDELIGSDGTTKEQDLESLSKKFKQDFTTKDNTLLKSANTVAIEVMRLILVEDLNYRFGALSPEQIRRYMELPHRTYLDELIGFSKMTVESLSLTYRFDFSRPDTISTTYIRENILTLQSYLRDSRSIDIHPFFLYKDEWRAIKNPFFSENHYSIKRSLFATKEDRGKLESIKESKIHDLNYYIKINRISTEYLEVGPQGLLKTWLDKINLFLAIDNNLVTGHYHFASGKYDLALKDYENVEIFIKRVGEYWSISWEDVISFKESFNDKLDETVILNKLNKRYEDRPLFFVNSKETLVNYENKNVVSISKEPPPETNDPFHMEFLRNIEYDLISLLLHVKFFVLPLCKADISSAKGNYSEAASYYGKVLNEKLFRTSQTSVLSYLYDDYDMLGDLPWFWNESRNSSLPNYPYLNENCEIPFLKLRLGELYIAWADQLYRSDHEPDVLRARELYKALLLMYGIDPLKQEGLVHAPPSPAPDKKSNSNKVFPAEHVLPHNIHIEEKKSNPSTSSPGTTIDIKPVDVGVFVTPMGAPFMDGITGRLFGAITNSGVSPLELIDLIERQYYDFAFNPAIIAQQTRALMGIYKIDSGLNFYGYSSNMMPMLRYKPIVSQAQKFAILAEEAEDDFISFTQSSEEAELNFINLKSASQIAGLRMQIEDYRIEVAKDNVKQASFQLKQITSAFNRKKQEVEDHNSTCGQVKDFFKGVGEFVGKVPGKGLEFIGSSYASGFGFGGASAAGASSVGLGIGGGFALVGAAAIYSQSSMSDAMLQREFEMEQLENSMKAIKASFDAREIELSLAQVEKSIASLYSMSIQEELSFNTLRNLNYDMYSRMAYVMNTIMCRYIDLGTSTAWLAERALSYEQDRDIRLIRFDYFNLQNKGILAADKLQSDLALLEAERLNGFKENFPVKWTVSLARDFPLQFGQLKAKGKCTFVTSTAILNLAYPGCYAHRIRNVEIAVTAPLTKIPVRGLLINHGYSRVEEEEINSFHNVVRPLDVYPLSEFRIKEDIFIYELPGETLMPFEGSGFETIWELELPPSANIDGLTDIADICITFSLNCKFSLVRKDELSNKKTVLIRSALFSAKKLNYDSFNIFCSNPINSDFEFVITEGMFSNVETNREVTNVSIYFIGNNLKNLKGSISSNNTTANFITDDVGLAHSNKVSSPLNYSIPPSTLDLLASGKPERTWKITIEPESTIKILFSDIVLGIEYNTQIQYI